MITAGIGTFNVSVPLSVSRSINQFFIPIGKIHEKKYKERSRRERLRTMISMIFKEPHNHTFPSVLSIFAANVHCGQPNNAAVIGPV